ncbi:cupin [Helicobacter didelphidarum]|uniref:Cupin n=1 Tax=Helicobacter didelphidarum TaxID=2040648 RepID=A0A3D8INH9_9HELI|nr:cupin [Helicobacter didelphidarum]
MVSWNIENFIYNEIKLNVLAQNSASKEIQIIMPKNSEMKEHKAPFAISVQVLRGWIEFSIDDKIMKLQELDMISLEANIPHSLKALKDSIVRLSLAKNDSVARVNAVLKN